MSEKRTIVPEFAPKSSQPSPSMPKKRTPLPSFPGDKPTVGSAGGRDASLSSHQQRRQSTVASHSIDWSRVDESAINDEAQAAEVAAQKAAWARLEKYHQLLQSAAAARTQATESDRFGSYSMIQRNHFGRHQEIAIERQGQYQHSLQDRSARVPNTYQYGYHSSGTIDRHEPSYGHGHPSSQTVDHRGHTGLIRSHGVDRQNPAADNLVVQKKVLKVGLDGDRSEYAKCIREMYIKWEKDLILSNNLNRKQLLSRQTSIFNSLPRQSDAVMPASSSTSHRSASSHPPTLHHTNTAVSQYQSMTRPALPHSSVKPIPPDSWTVHDVQIALGRVLQSSTSDLALPRLTRADFVCRRLPDLPKLNRFTLHLQARLPPLPQDEQEPDSRQSPLLTIQDFKKRQQFLDGISLQREWFAIKRALEEEKAISWQEGIDGDHMVQEYCRDLFNAKEGELYEYKLNEICNTPQPKLTRMALSAFEKEWKLRRVQRHKREAGDIEVHRLGNYVDSPWPPEPRFENQNCKSSSPLFHNLPSIFSKQVKTILTIPQIATTTGNSSRINSPASQSQTLSSTSTTSIRSTSPNSNGANTLVD